MNLRRLESTGFFLFNPESIQNDFESKISTQHRIENLGKNWNVLIDLKLMVNENQWFECSISTLDTTVRRDILFEYTNFDRIHCWK